MFGSHRTPIYHTTYHTYIRQKYSPPRTNFEETNYMVFGTYGWMVWRMKFVAWFMLLICMLEQFAKYCSFVRSLCYDCYCYYLESCWFCLVFC